MTKPPHDANLSTCLLVIDAQQSFLHGARRGAPGEAAYLVAQNALIGAAHEAAWPIVRVLHQHPLGAADDPFAVASGLVRPMDGLAPFEAATTVHKSRHSALVGTGLDVWLTERGVRRIVISGIRTEQCCETTARHASDMGWQVVFVPEATHTWEMALTSGARLGVGDIRERTAAVLHGRFAQVLGVAEVRGLARGG
jgi:nicotinamidase-related amidase